MNRIIPDIPQIKAHWDKRSSDIPDYLMVPMSDKTKVRYVPDIQQPKPQFKSRLDHFSELCVGYERKEAE